MTTKQPDGWSSKLGVIMAVAGSAVGLGNFLRFPGLVADKETGGGAFLIAYFISLLIVGLPICWVEWTLGRFGGTQGFNSSPGIFHAIIRKPWGKYVGLLGFIIPVGVYFYYVVIESWCLGYAWNSFSGGLDLGKDPAAYAGAFAAFTGLKADGAILTFGGPFLFFVGVFVLNFVVIYRGISRGIEFICKWGMPVLIVIALILLVRVMTLGTPDPAKPELSVWNGLGYMWNPHDIGQGLSNPAVWLKAASQVFFTLSVGFGVIITYAS
jgi:SNF family Na+-dependent transporter